VEKVENLGKRLQQLMAERDLNYDRLGRLLDMKPQTLNRYVLGQREPKARVVTEMAMKLHVDPMWL
jgi:repressor LexA